MRARGVYEERQKAEEALAEAQSKAKKGDNFIIQVREGGRTRCAGFCQVAPFCDQYQTYLKTKQTQE